ncbi:MAG: heavy metal sensor histidine kinase [Acidobacteria bacterium]|nr:heavy metal sensor histidine kinase [Acidobacteriota bacterium]
MLPWRPRSVRLRLTLWYSAAVALVVLLYAVGVYMFVSRSLREELDRVLHDDFELVEESLENNDRGTDTSRWTSDPAHHADGSEPARWVEVWAPLGQLRFRSPGLDERAAPKAVPQTYEYVSVASSGGVPLRTLTGAHSVGASEFVIRVTRSEERVRHELNELLAGLALGLPIAVILAGVGGYQLARRALSPVERMTEQAQTITAERLRARLPIENPDDELGRLATVFNDMLQRLEESFDRMGRFTADASHELRTPLTAIRSVGEVGLREQHDAAGYREVIGSMLEEADRLTRLVESLLLLSRADSGRATVKRDHVALLGVAREVAAHLAVLSEERGQRSEINGDSGITAHVDPMLLREALVNIVDNAIKYSPRGAEIRILVARDGRGGVAIEITDRGPGIAAEHHTRIFERFYRVEEGRSRDHGGSGLGLAIARWAVETNGGHIDLDSEPGRGSTFRIVLPVGASERSDIRGEHSRA